MDYSYSKAHLKAILTDLHASENLKKKMRYLMTICEKHNVHPMDIVLTHDVYPVLEEKFGDTQNEIKEYLNGWIRKLYKEDKDIFKRLFYYNKRPTLKKFIQLILDECLV